MQTTPKHSRKPLEFLFQIGAMPPLAQTAKLTARFAFFRDDIGHLCRPKRL